MDPVEENQLLHIQSQTEKLQSQKDKLLRELNDIEGRYERMNRLYRKFFPVILNTLARGDSLFSKACKDLAVAMKKGESESRIEYIFEQIRTAMLKEDIGPVPIQKKKGLLSSVFKGSRPDFVDEYRLSYHDVVNNLRSTLEGKYSQKLDRITEMINAAEDTADISDIRENVFNLVFQYISDSNDERENVNSFVKEIAGKILEIESKLNETYQNSDDYFSAGQEFESELSGQIDGLKQSRDIAASLEDLKIQISKRLESIENALSKKQTLDKAVKEIADKNRHAFRTGFVRLRQELEEATRYSEALEKKLVLDQLTGAYNRRAYDQRIEEEMARFLRYGDFFSLMVIDADRFKSINDNYGHAIGDRCLQEIIKRTIPLLRKNDMLARYGGEEFVVIMPHTDAQGARDAGEKIRQTIEKIEFLYKNKTVRVTVSIGISQTREDDRGHQEIFERADLAVYKAKENGRNQVMVN